MSNLERLLKKSLTENLSKSVVPNSVSVHTPKRYQMDEIYEEEYESIRKITHLDVAHRQMATKDNPFDSKSTGKKTVTSQCTSTKDSIENISAVFHTLDFHRPESEIGKQASQQTTAETIVNGPSLSEKFGHLINKKAESCILSQKERLLISIQQKLDHFLFFSKSYRQKKKGEFFRNIRKTLLENNNIFLQIGHIKKILWIESLYLVKKENSRDGDYLIDIDPSKGTILERKEQFQKSLLKYVRSNLSDDQKEIPEVQFPFEDPITESKKILDKAVKNIFNSQEAKKKKVDRFFVLQSKDSASYKKSQAALETNIKTTEKILERNNQLNIDILSNKMFETKQLSEPELMNLVEQIKLVYMNRSVTNMLQESLVEQLGHKVALANFVIQKAVDALVEISHGSGVHFLKRLSHKSKSIIQINKNHSADFLNRVRGNLDRFSFEMEMSESYKKDKIQELRQKLVHESVGEQPQGQTSQGCHQGAKLSSPLGQVSEQGSQIKV